MTLVAFVADSSRYQWTSGVVPAGTSHALTGTLFAPLPLPLPRLEFLFLNPDSERDYYSVASVPIRCGAPREGPWAEGRGILAVSDTVGNVRTRGVRQSLYSVCGPSRTRSSLGLCGPPYNELFCRSRAHTNIHLHTPRPPVTHTYVPIHIHTSTHRPTHGRTYTHTPIHTHTRPHPDHPLAHTYTRTYKYPPIHTSYTRTYAQTRTHPRSHTRTYSFPYVHTNTHSRSYGLFTHLRTWIHVHTD